MSDKQQDKGNLNELIGYKKGFHFSRMVVLISIVAVALVSLISTVLVVHQMNEMRGEIAVLSPKGPINKAVVVDREKVRKYEYQAVMKNVFRYLYEHDEYNFKRRLEKANNILGQPGIRLTKEFKKQSHLKRLREYNLLLRVQITDYKVNMSSKTGMIAGIQTVIWGDRTKKIKYKVRCKFRDMLGNSQKNPHGIKIVKWEETMERTIKEQ